jgi:cyclic-di-GMP phosphodiesterase TipF (flagellum assembly factor)
VRIGRVVAVGVCAISLSAAALLYAGLGLSPVVAATAGIVVACLAAILAGLTRRPAPDARRIEPRLDEAAGPSRRPDRDDLAERLDRLEGRVAELGELINERTRTTARAVAAELDALGAVIRELAEAVARHDAELAEPREAAPDPVGVVEVARTEPEPVLATAAATPVAPAAGPLPPAATLDEEGRRRIQAVLGRAIPEDRFELQLQSVVTLPQRKVKLYEARQLLRGEDGQTVEPDLYLPEAESLGRVGGIDTLLIARALRVIRHLKARRRDVALLCRISARSFVDPAAFSELVDFARARREDAEQILLGIDQASYVRLGALEIESLEALKQLGLRFALDEVTDLRLDARQLGERGFRMVKIPAELLLAAERGAAATEIHAADLAGLLSRYGVSLIATGIATEKTVLDLLDYGIPLAQGDLFAPARPVRLDVLEAAVQAAAAPPSPAPPSPSASAEVARTPERTPFRSILRRASA